MRGKVRVELNAYRDLRQIVEAGMGSVWSAGYTGHDTDGNAHVAASRQGPTDHAVSYGEHG